MKTSEYFSGIINKSSLNMLIIVSGPMFAGKTTWLLEYASKLSKGTFKLYKPNIDSRYADDKCVTHDGLNMPSFNLDVENPQFINLGEKIKTIIIDELNFFNADKLIPAIYKQLKLKRTIVGAGLNYDYQKVPFGSTIPLAKIANKSISLFSICDKCRKKAHTYTGKYKMKIEFFWALQTPMEPVVKDVGVI